MSTSLPTNAAVAITGNKRRLENDENESIHKNKRLKVTGEVPSGVPPAKPLRYAPPPGIRFIRNVRPPCSRDLLLPTAESKQSKSYLDDKNAAPAKKKERQNQGSNDNNNAWKCNSCLHWNHDDMESHCEQCGERRSIIGEATGWGNLFAGRPAAWKCSTCSSPNKMESTICASCETPRPNNTDAPTLASNYLTSSLPSEAAASMDLVGGGIIGRGGFVFPSSTAGKHATGSDSSIGGKETASLSFGVGKTTTSGMSGVATLTNGGFSFGATTPTLNAALDSKADGERMKKNAQGFNQDG